MLRGKKILLGITGSIAAYKIPILIRYLKKEGVDIQVMLTPSARDFITPLTLSVLTERPVLTKAFNEENGHWNSHVELSMWADVFLIAPASANTLAKMAGGIADNLLLTTYLSAKCPVLFAPAMDLDMYRHSATQENIATLEKKGHYHIHAREGELASGLCGEGRMEEPENIHRILSDFFKNRDRLRDKKILVTAGPTYENLDPVRYIGNYSSGLMGFEIARKAAENGAEVYLVSGPTHLLINHPNIYRINVNTAKEMYESATVIYEKCDAAIMTAAVADFTPDKVVDQKIKKEENLNEIKLKPTKDILKTLGQHKKNSQILIGFALETNKVIENAKQKLENKNLDFIVLNSLNDEGSGFGTKTNKVTIIDKDGQIQDLPLKQKDEVAADIIEKLITLIK